MTRRKPGISSSNPAELDAALARQASAKKNIGGNLRGYGEAQVRLFQREGSRHPLLIYASEQGIRVELPWHDGSLWATQRQLAEMFGVQVPAISKHLKNIFDEGELPKDPTVSIMETVQIEGSRSVSRNTEHYNLNAIISVGYRIESKIGTMFRVWSTERVVQILTKGFYVDKERLKEPVFQSRVEEIKSILQDIRSEQASVHRELEQICAQCQDYRTNDPHWQRFFRNTSAAIFYAAVQQTPAEIIRSRADAGHASMGLTTWPKATIRKIDITVGKNYLGPIELNDLNRFSSLLLDFILDQAEAGRLVTMEAAGQRIEELTVLTGRKVLRGGGSIARTEADAHANAQYAIFDANRKQARQLKGDLAFDDPERD